MNHKNAMLSFQRVEDNFYIPLIFVIFQNNSFLVQKSASKHDVYGMRV